MNAKRIAELRERALEGLKNAQEYHDIFLEGVVKDSWGKRVSFWTDLLAILKDYEVAMPLLEAAKNVHEDDYFWAGRGSVSSNTLNLLATIIADREKEKEPTP